MAEIDLDKLQDFGGIEDDDPIIDNSAFLTAAPEIPAVETLIAETATTPEEASFSEEEKVEMVTVTEESDFESNETEMVVDQETEMGTFRETAVMEPMTLAETQDLKPTEEKPEVPKRRLGLGMAGLPIKLKKPTFAPAAKTEVMAEKAEKPKLHLPKLPKIPGSKKTWGLVGLVLVVSLIGAVGWNWWTSRKPQKPEATDYQLDGGMIPVTGACEPIVEKKLQATIDDFARLIEGEGFTEMGITEELQAEFDTFQNYALGTNADHCFALNYCRNEFSDNVAFDLAYARRAFVAKHYGAESGYNHTGEWLPAKQLRDDVTEYFGVTKVDVGRYPVQNGTINDVYNGANDTFLVADDVSFSGPYNYQLQEIRTNESTGQVIFVAGAVFQEGKCSVKINEHQCTCPTAKYYLIKEPSPADGHLVYAREYVQVTGTREVIE